MKTCGMCKNIEKRTTKGVDWFDCKIGRTAESRIKSVPPCILVLMVEVKPDTPAERCKYFAAQVETETVAI